MSFISVFCHACRIMVVTLKSILKLMPLPTEGTAFSVLNLAHWIFLRIHIGGDGCLVQDKNIGPFRMKDIFSFVW